MSEELNAYIELINLLLRHPFTTEIPIANGRRKSSEEFVFAITPSRYRKLEQIRGDYNFKYSSGEYECNIVQLTRNQVKLRIEDLDAGQRHIENGAINVDTSNILEREMQGLKQLRENFSERRQLLFGDGDISGGARSECIFEEEGLNEEQKRAIEYAVGVQDVYLIWGPPGTGKTTIVPEIVRNYIRLHKDTKILVCSYTNRAVDNVVMKLFDNRRCKKIIVRFGYSTLTDKYKDALFDEQLKKKRKEIERELGRFKEKIKQLFREKEKIEKERKSKNKEAETVEKDKEDIKSEINALNAEITYITDQITDNERSLLTAQFEEEIDQINGQLQEYREKLIELPIKKREFNEEMEELKIHVSRLEDVKSDINRQLAEWDIKEKDTANIIRIIEYYLDFAEGPKQEIEALSAEISRIKNLIAEREHSLLTAQFMEEINRIDNELRNYKENFDELQQEKEEINRAIEGIENEVPRLNSDIAGIREQLANLENNEPDIANIIHIVSSYLEYARRNKIVALWKKYVFKRRNPLYEQYEQKINELQLARRTSSELEKILRLLSDLNERERTLREKEEELRRKMEELIAVEENYTSLSGTIERREQKLGDLKRDKDLLARGELEYDKDALIRENPELRALYDDLNWKNNRIRNGLSDFIRGRSELLYEQYKQETTELQLEGRQRIELEIILQENLEEQKNEREEITKLQNDLNAREREIREKENELERKKEELCTIEKNHASLSGNIESGEKKLKELKRDIESLAHGKLEYDSDALRREKSVLRELYNELRNKQSDKNQKEVDLKGMEQKRIDLSGLIEKLMNSVREKIAEIKAAEQEMQEEMKRKMEEARLAILNEKQIIATTNLRAYDKLFASIKFDLVIMDEAGAIDLPGAVLPFLKGNKFILLGDPKQLPPILVDRPPEISDFVEQNPRLRLSIFERFYKSNYGDNHAVMLTSQYRMKRKMADFVSSSFYDGLLNTPAEIEITERLRECPDDLISNCYPMVCFPRRFWTDYEGRSVSSEVEIGFVKKIIEKFRREYGESIYEEMAIISPYRAQIDIVEDEIPDIECGTVHTFQGQEKRIIIFATANYRRSQSSGFGKPLEGPTSKNLLNVAVSRAKEKFIIIGSRELFERVPIYGALYGHIKEYGDVHEQNCCMMCGEDVPEERSAICSEECYSLFQLRVDEERNPSSYTAEDEHSLRSTHEMLIDNWFHRNGIKHQVEKQVPVNRLMRCDWFLPRGEIYVEYWGLMHEEWYRKTRKVKEKLYMQANLRLRSIEPEDMKKLDERLRRIFGDVLNQ